MAGLEDSIGLDRERAARSVKAEDADQLLVDVELAARDAEGAGNGEEKALIGSGIAEDGVEHRR